MDHSVPLSILCDAKTDRAYLTASAGLVSDHTRLMHHTQTGVLFMLPGSRQLAYYHCMQFGMHFGMYNKRAHRLTTQIPLVQGQLTAARQYQSIGSSAATCFNEPHYLTGPTNHLHYHAAAALCLCCLGPGVEAPALLLIHHQAAQMSRSEPESPCLQNQLHVLRVCHDVRRQQHRKGSAARFVCTEALLVHHRA